MRNLKYNILILFILFLFATIGSGFILKIKKYENNFLINEKGFQKIVITQDSYQHLKNSVDKNIFYFFINNENLKASIFYRIDNEKNVELFFKIKNFNDNNPLIEIKYYLYQKNYWSQIFN